MKILTRLLALFALVIILAGGLFLAESYSFSSANGPARTETIVLIKPGTGVNAIAQRLRRELLISNELLFRVGLRLHRPDQTLKAGEYAIPARASMAQIADILISGKSIQHKLTVAEGLTSDMVWKLVRDHPVLIGDAGPVPVEGTLLPETYLFIRGTTRAELIGRMKKAQTDLLAKLWPRRAADLPYSTQMQAIVLASIVEKETGLAKERPLVASVFVNRLRLGMRLQSDPTIIYGITKGYPLGRRIRLSEISAATPYNTYVIPGLPQSPIANPSKEAIAAVLNPPQTDYLYFVAKEVGGASAFSATLAEQQKNVEAWRRYRAETGK